MGESIVKYKILVEVKSSRMSDGSDIDLAALGFDASKQLTTNGPAQ